MFFYHVLELACLQAISDEHNETPAAVETVVSSGGDTPKQESPAQNLSEHTDDGGVDPQQALALLGEEGVDAAVEGRAGSPEQPGEEEMTNEHEREDEGTHLTQEVLTGREVTGCTINLCQLPMH